MNEPIRILDRYEMGRFIGRGGMGEVYQGRDLHTDDPVAIKVLRPELIYDHPELVERFRREGEALRRLNHPNIVKVLAMSETDHRHYLVMEYVGGGTLADLLKHQPQLPLDRALAIALELADALTRTHHLNIVHRDIKPANVLLAEDGTPRLTDFGLAFAAGTTRITRPGIAVGTWLYICPELCTGAASEPDMRSDVWSFGIVLYEMLAGRPPFNGDSLPTIIREITESPLLNVTEFRDDVPAALNDLIRRMLMKDPLVRIASFRQIGAELEAIASGSSIPHWHVPPPHDSAQVDDDSIAIEVQWTDEVSLQSSHGSPPRLLTKVAVPLPRAQLVARAQLLQTLDSGLRRGHLMTLVSAPPGFGKTTLISAWLMSKIRPVAWFSLDASDNDPVQFFQYLVTALQQVDPDLGKTTEQLLQSPQLPAAASLMTPIINDVAAATPLILVLDDYQVIHAPPVHEAVRFLLEHVPRTLHLVIITREDPPVPLARLRVRDQLTEIRERDLRFTGEETAAFLSETMHLDLAAEAVEKLGVRTEGWIAGLQLAALALQESPDDMDTFIAEFTGDHRYVMDYLLSEVLEHQPPVVRDFLRQTSILGQLTAALCDAVTEHTDSQALLEQLEHANLFVIPLDGRRVWYRYHQLFADVLRLTLTPDEQALLHGRASRWFEAQALGIEAIQHGLAAARISGDYTDAARLICTYTDAYINEGRLATVLGWLDALPDATIRQDVDLAVYKAWVLTLAGDTTRAAEYSTLALTLCDTLVTEASRGRLALVQSFLALVRGEFAEITRWAREALALLPADLAHWRMMALWVLSEAQERNAPIDDAIAALREACLVGHTVGKPIVATMLDTSLAWSLNLKGKRRDALAICQEAFTRYQDDQGVPLPVTALLLNRLAFFHYQANQLAQANAYHQQAQALAEQLALDLVLSASRGLAAMLHAACGAFDEALVQVQQALQHVGREGLADVTWIGAIAGDVHLKRGDLAAAQRWAESAGLTPDLQPYYLHLEQHVVYVRLLLAQDRLDEAQGCLDRLEEFVMARGYQRWLISVNILQALVAERRHDAPRVRSYLSEAVRIAAPEDYYRLFLDEDREDTQLMALLPRVRATAPVFVDTLLDVPDDTAIPDALPLAESLSEREIEVLRLIAHGLSNAEIAERLVLSTGTVKQHINHIYGKLDVHSRTQAVAKARTLGLIDESSTA